MERQAIRFGRRQLLLAGLVIVIAMGLYFAARHDSSLYKRDIVEVTAVVNSHTGTAEKGSDFSAEFTQTLTAVYLNGPNAGTSLTLSNNSSTAQVFNEYYAVNDQLFLKTGPDGKLQVQGLKRDASLVYILALFTLAMVLVGGLKGLKSVLTVLLNLFIFAGLIWLYLKGINLYCLGFLSLLFFVPIGILIVSGLNPKSFSAIIGTVVSCLVAVAIAVIVIWATGAKGVHYEEMEFLTRSPVEIFIFGLLIGTLGAIMDIAISVASFVEELRELDPDISRKALLKSGLTVGNDIVGTMANTLLLAAVAGTLPTLLLYLFNGFSLSYLLKVSLSLELIRALTGSIGIVLSIPLTLWISAFFAARRPRQGKQEVVQ